LRYSAANSASFSRSKSQSSCFTMSFIQSVDGPNDVCGLTALVATIALEDHSLAFDCVVDPISRSDQPAVPKHQCQPVCSHRSCHYTNASSVRLQSGFELLDPLSCLAIDQKGLAPEGWCNAAIHTLNDCSQKATWWQSLCIASSATFGNVSSVVIALKPALIG
jgi:hypothetical protein